MRVLIVGAGAVGQTYARALLKADCDVVFYVREKYRAALESPGTLPFYPLNERARTDPDVLGGYGVVSSLDEVAASDWDAVWLCVSSTALQAGWFDAFAKAIDNAVVVSLQPGLIDPDWLHARVPRERLVSGMIPFIAWQAPLPGEHLSPPGIMVWHPPLMATPLSGPLAAVTEQATLLRRGGLKVRLVASAGEGGATASAVLLSIVAALEGAGWRFSELRRANHMRRAIYAKNQALAVAAAVHGTRAPWVLRMLGPWMVRLATRIAPLVVPFDLERYLAYHFRKVGDQTRANLALWRDGGAQRGLPVDAIAALEATLRAVDARERAAAEAP